jgi:hypothetical protein
MNNVIENDQSTQEVCRKRDGFLNNMKGHSVSVTIKEIQ